MSAAGHVSALRGTAPALRRAEPDAGRRTPHVLRPSGPLLPLAFARGVTFFALATFGALHWMAMLEPTARRPGVGRGRRGAARDGRACCGAARLSGATPVGGGGGHQPAGDPARVHGRRRLRRAAAARQLGRAGHRHPARHRRPARRARALPRHRPVDPARDPARRHDAGRPRGADRVLAAAQRHRLPDRRARDAGDALRRAGRRARLRGRVPARRAAGDARAGASCGWSGCGSTRPGRPRCSRSASRSPR